jgi:hypothetical protein
MLRRLAVPLDPMPIPLALLSRKFPASMLLSQGVWYELTLGAPVIFDHTKLVIQAGLA